MCHKGYTGSFLDHFATICSLVSGSSGSPIAFSYVHRLHHKFTDTENDPHSPKHIGRWRVWLLLWRVSSFRPSYIKDFITSQYQIALHRHWTKIQILVMITVYLINPIILLLIISPCVVISFHCSGLINVLGHWNGEARNINELRFLPDASWKHFEHHKKY
jgi:stearoyl-CoA desaturase (delta-9 desaturase)